MALLALVKLTTALPLYQLYLTLALVKPTANALSDSLIVAGV